jgi:predicted component of type VI protein secretion system
MATMPNLIKMGSEDSLSLESALNLVLELGIQRQNVRVIAEGGFQRFRGEIIHQEPGAGEPIGSKTEVILTVTETGLYDTLPEGVFSSLGVLDESTHEVERTIRNFLSSFDTLHFHTASSLEYQIAVSYLIFKDESLTKSFLRLFGFPTQGWDQEDLMIWRTLLPYGSTLVGTKAGIEKVAKAFLGVEAEVIENTPHQNEIPPEFQSRLGERGSSLGEDLLVGDRFEETDSSFDLRLGPIQIKDLPDFRQGGKKREKLERILAHFVPGNMSCTIQLILEETDQKFKLDSTHPGRDRSEV